MIVTCTFAEASHAPETNERPSGDSDRLMTSPVWPTNDVVCWPVSMSHRALHTHTHTHTHIHTDGHRDHGIRCYYIDVHGQTDGRTDIVVNALTLNHHLYYYTSHFAGFFGWYISATVHCLRPCNTSTECLLFVVALYWLVRYEIEICVSEKSIIINLWWGLQQQGLWTLTHAINR